MWWLCTVAPLAPGVNYFYFAFARYYFTFARYYFAFAGKRDNISQKRNNIEIISRESEIIWWFTVCYRSMGSVLDFWSLGCYFDVSSLISPHCPRQPRWRSGLRRSLVHSLMIDFFRHCVLRNWDRIPVRALSGLIYRADMCLDMSVTVTKRR